MVSPITPLPLGALFRPPDPREFRHRWTAKAQAAPDYSQPANLSQFAPPIFTQQLNDCVANAVVRALMIAARADENIPNPVMLGRHAPYYWAREIDGDPNEDQGTYATSALDGLLKHGGVPKESVDPYPGDYRAAPSAAALADAPAQAWLKEHAPVYHSDPGGMVDGTIAALQAGRPVVIGMWWYAQFDTPGANGVISLPIRSRVRGGHEVCIEDFEPAAPGREMTFLTGNSWGQRWGQGGNFRIPASLLESNVIMDARVIIPAAAPAPEPEPTPDRWQEFLSWWVPDSDYLDVTRDAAFLRQLGDIIPAWADYLSGQSDTPPSSTGRAA